MSFFLREYFNLPSNTFQEGIALETVADGSIYQDGTYCYINTYANADGALIVSEDSLTLSEFKNKAIKFTISYKLISLPASDVIEVLFLTQSATQPVPGTVGDVKTGVRLYNDAGSYKEFWYVYFGGAGYYWKQSAATWLNAFNILNFTRTISLNTAYTVTVTIHPDTGKVDFTNGVQSVTTTAGLTLGTNLVWWMAGDYETASAYGSLALDYLYVDDITTRNRFSIVNSLTSSYQKSPFFTALNNLTTRYRDSFTLKNDILDHEPYRSRFTALNNVGVPGQLIYLDGSWQTVVVEGKQLSNTATIEIDGNDVSDKVTDWSIDYDDQTVAKTVSVTVKDRAYAQSIVPRNYSDSTFDDARVEIIDHDGYSLGEFLIENKSETARHGEYACTLTGRSMTALLDIPYSANLQTLYDEATSKIAVVGDLAAVKSLMVQWGIPDSILPAGALACDDEPPISVIMKIVEAGGGLVYTNREDDLVCAYKDYETSGKSPVMSLTSGDIVSISQSRTVPRGENSIEVSGYQDAALTGGWAQITLESSKDKLKSNGFDSCTITAICRNEDLSIPDVELIEDEEQTPAQNDHYEISVSKMIDTDGGGVVSIVKQSDSSVVAGPYEVLDGYTIRVGTAMDDTTYLVTYWGGETVTFSVDEYADIAPTEVLVKNGRAQATLRASAGGGGAATISGDYLDAQTAKITVNIADPRVGSIQVSADPSSVAVSETSTIKIQVLDSDGYPADNGLYVNVSVLGHGQMIDYAGIVTPSTATTTTETVTDGGIENGQYNPIYPVSEIEISTQFPISSLTSIYRYEKGVPYTDVNYATSATVLGNRITLATPLPSPVTPIQVTYECTGIATVSYTYPAYPTRNTPQTSIQNMIVAQCGGEYGSTFINIEGPSGGGGGFTPIGGGGGGGVAYVTIEFQATPAANSDGRLKGTAVVKDVDMLNGSNRDWYRANFDTADAQWAVREGVGGITWYEYHDLAEKRTVLMLIVQALEELPGDGTEDTIKGNYVSGTRLVRIAGTETGIKDVDVSINWGYDTETAVTNDFGQFSFHKGMKGLSGTASLSHADYVSRTAAITIPGDLYTSNVNDDDTGARKWAPVKVKVSVPYRRVLA